MATNQSVAVAVREQRWPLLDTVLGPIAPFRWLQEEEDRLTVEEHSHPQKAASEMIYLALDPWIGFSCDVFEVVKAKL